MTPKRFRNGLPTLDKLIVVEASYADLAVWYINIWDMVSVKLYRTCTSGCANLWAHASPRRLHVVSVVDRSN